MTTSVPLRFSIDLILFRIRSFAPLEKEARQLRRRLVGQYAADRFEPVIEPGSIPSQFLQLRRRANLRIGRPEDQSLDASVKRRPETHQTRLDRAIQRRSDQPVVFLSGRRVPQSQDLGVSRRVRQANRRVRTAADDLIIEDHDRADRYLAQSTRRCGLLQGEPHESLVDLLAP